MAPRLNELPLGWVEEPIPADRPEAEWRQLAEAYAAPLAGGENLRGQDLLRAASDPWLGVVQPDVGKRSEEHTSELQSRQYLVCRLLLEKKKNYYTHSTLYHASYLQS